MHICAFFHFLYIPVVLNTMYSTVFTAFLGFFFFKFLLCVHWVFLFVSHVRDKSQFPCDSDSDTKLLTYSFNSATIMDKCQHLMIQRDKLHILVQISLSKCHKLKI